MKTCRKCGLVKDYSNYYKATSGTKDGYRHECKKCWAESCMSYHRDNRDERLEAARSRYYKTKYNLTTEEATELKESSSGCEVCGSNPVVIDHCHSSGKVRGLLCNKCNQALGSLNDDPSIIYRLGDYMKKHLTKE